MACLSWLACDWRVTGGRATVAARISRWGYVRKVPPGILYHAVSKMIAFVVGMRTRRTCTPVAMNSAVGDWSRYGSAEYIADRTSESTWPAPGSVFFPHKFPRCLLCYLACLLTSQLPSAILLSPPRCSRDNAYPQEPPVLPQAQVAHRMGQGERHGSLPQHPSQPHPRSVTGCNCRIGVRQNLHRHHRHNLPLLPVSRPHPCGPVRRITQASRADGVPRPFSSSRSPTSPHPLDVRRSSDARPRLYVPHPLPPITVMSI
jgi:hypothetical protein